MLHADESYNGRTVKLKVGESLEIALGENPTTGYRWRLRVAAMDTAMDAAEEKAHSACVFVKDSYEPGHTKVSGQGGIRRWQFQAVAAGVCKIELEYRRPWEQNKLPERTFRIQGEVRKGLQDKKTSKPSE